MAAPLMFSAITTENTIKTAYPVTTNSQ